nr:extracellular solute-binding protein [uncultured Cohaesibacter sp.]
MRFNKLSISLIALASIYGTAAKAEELTLLTLGGPDSIAIAEALTSAYTAKHPDVTFAIETRPGGGEGDNVVKTRLATGEMSDVFAYNAGSLLQALRPKRTLVPLNDLPNMGNVSDSYISVVKEFDGNIYGIPVEAAMAGGILYSRPLYEKLGLEVPKTWQDFMANNARIAAETDATPVVQTYRDTWTAQMPILSDYSNVVAEVPDFAEQFTANKAKFATTPAALRSFEHLEEMAKAGYFNEDFGAATYADGLEMIAKGTAAHYPMLTVGISTINQNTPDLLKNVGFFAQPGQDADKNQLTIWLPTSYYIPASSQHIETARAFLDFVATPEACEAVIARVGVNGPYLINGCKLPEDLPAAVRDILPYFEKTGGTVPALEYVSPVKGPMLEQLAVEVGTGIRDATSAAELYDRDVAKQARQLRLKNW